MRHLTKPNDANKLQLVVFMKFFLEIKIEILFDKSEIHVQTQQPCKHKYRGTKTCSVENKICNKINTAHGHRIQKQQQILQLPPIGTNYAENPEPVLQKTKYTTTKIQPMDRHNRNNNRYYTQHPCKHRLCRNLQPVLQKTEYAVAEIQPWTYITEIATDITLNPPKHRLSRKYKCIIFL